LYSVHLCYSGLNCMRFSWKFSIPCWFTTGISCTNSWVHQPLCQYLVHSGCCYMSGSFSSSKPKQWDTVQVHSQQHVFQHACVGVTGSVGGNRKPAPVTRPGDWEAMVCHWYVTPQARAMVCNNFSLNSAFTNLH